jgi:hypothetical protein
MGDTVGPDGLHGVGIVTYNDHIDPETGEWVEVTTDLSTVIIVGDYIGAQMAGFDAAAQIGLIDHLQDGEINVPYVERTIVIGGTPPVVTTRVGALPDGMFFDEVSGVLSGTPTVSGTFIFDVHSVDAVGGDVTTTFHLTIVDPGVVQPPHVTVTTIASPSDGGSVSGNGEYLVGDTVTVVATENPGFAFVAWTDGGTVVSSSASFQFVANVNRELVANFLPIYNVTTSASPVAGGATGGDGTYISGDVVTVSASADPAYRFVNWTEAGAIVSTLADYQFAIAGHRTLVANFALKAPILEINSVTASKVRSKVEVTVVIGNIGDAVAEAVTIAAKKDATIDSKATLERAPIAFGNIEPGGAATTALTFSGVKAGTWTLNLRLGYTGGSVTLTAPISIP